VNRASSSKRIRAVVAMLGVGLGLPAAALTVTVSQKEELQLHAGDTVIEAKLSKDGLLGPNVQVQRYGSAIRGRAFNAPVSLQVTEGRVSGQVGSRPVNLQVNQSNDGVDVNGLFAGQLSNLKIRPTALSGRIGHCDYDLTLAGDHYSGFRTCDGQGFPIPTTLQLPSGMSSLSDAQQVAFLGLLLSKR